MQLSPTGILSHTATHLISKVRPSCLQYGLVTQLINHVSQVYGLHLYAGFNLDNTEEFPHPDQS